MPTEAATALWGVGAGLLLFWLGSGAIAVWQGRRSAKAQVSGDEREARRDTLADRDNLLDRVLKRLGDVEARVGSLERTVIDYSDHIDVLEDFVWKVYRGEAQPPPPPRPTAKH